MNRVQEIIAEVGAKHGFSYVQMVGVRRVRSIVRARQEAYWRCLRDTGMTVSDIGRFFGGRTHGCVLRGASAHESRAV